ncbi:TPA: hypothetical protein ACGFCK_002128 [Clostridium perfringens]
MIVAINYSDENFRKSQKFNTKSAYKKGKVDKVIEYSPKDIDKDFFNKNKEILNKSRGGGYWLWKPYLILRTMNNLSNGDYIFYCDSGAYYINNIRYLINSLEKTKQDIMVFDLPLIEKQWTQKTTFKLMDCDNEKYMNSNQILATYILIKVSDESKIFMGDYLTFCENINCLIESDLYKNQNEFINHRHDQSILSLLCKKNNIVTFRDPSQYGIRPWEYLSNNRLYNVKKYTNSDYPQILVSSRKANVNMFRKKEFIKRILTKMGFLTEKRFIKKHNISINTRK